jgi:flap endonuclease-1
MGLRGLNRFLRANCQKNIRQISLWELKGKTVVVDASIYMYRFQGDGGLIEGMYQMVGLLRHNNITPIFVFDGKPPPEKKELLEKRKQDKLEAEKKFKDIKRQIASSNDDDDDIADLEAEADQLRRQFVRITGGDIADVKNLLRIMGISYYESDGESDGICAKMVQKKIAFACLSEDMDMFIYGCPRVLRYLSLLKSSVVMYDLRGIIASLRLPFEEFRDICVLAGTDYNLLSDDSLDLNKALRLYSKYSKNRNDESYIEWVIRNKYIKDMESFKNVTQMFNTQKVIIEKNCMLSSFYDKDALRGLLSEYGFVFP